MPTLVGKRYNNRLVVPHPNNCGKSKQQSETLRLDERNAKRLRSTEYRINTICAAIERIASRRQQTIQQVPQNLRVFISTSPSVSFSDYAVHICSSIQYHWGVPSGNNLQSSVNELAWCDLRVRILVVAVLYLDRFNTSYQTEALAEARRKLSSNANLSVSSDKTSDPVIVYSTHTLHLLLLAAIMTAVKYTEDRPGSGKVWRSISGVPISKLNKVERKFCEICKYDFNVSEEEYFHWFKKLAAH